MQTALKRTLQNRGMQVELCSDGRQALARWKEAPPDVVMLDLTLPGMDGLLVLEEARRSGLKTPVLILTARGTVGDRIIGLNTGADDYLPKPFDLDELEARLRALHRRAPSERAADAGIGGLAWDRESGAIHWRDQILELAPREAALLQALLARPGHAVTKERLFELVFPGETEVQYEAIEVVVYRLRKKLAPTGAKLVTLRGLGYLLKAE
jgi:two-component system response regulator TctD